MKRGVEVGGSITQGGSRCAPLPWAIFSLPLRGGRRNLLMSVDNENDAAERGRFSEAAPALSSAERLEGLFVGFARHVQRRVPVAGRSAGYGSVLKCVEARA